MRGELTLGNVILMVIVSAIWPWATALFIDAFMSAFPEPPASLSSPAYSTAAALAAFVKDNAATLTVASVLLTAILVRWRGL
ncbi:MAG: hypothetical protein ACO2PM_25125 [Pyrobaculum sp.]|jgi:hypothetical protein